MHTVTKTNERLARINTKYEFDVKPVIVHDLLVPVEIWGIIIEFLGDFNSINSLSCVCTQLLGITTYFRYVNDVYNYIRAKHLLKKCYSMFNLPKELISYRICLEYTKENSYISVFIPNKFITYQFCLSVCDNILYLAGIPRKFLTEKLLLKAILNTTAILSIFINIPIDLLTYKMCLLAIKRSIQVFHLIPDHFKTDELIQIYNKEKERLDEIKK